MIVQGFMTSKLVNQSFTERKKKLSVNNKSTLWSYPWRERKKKLTWEVKVKVWRFMAKCSWNWVLC